MEATGRDGGHGPWSYLGQIGYTPYSITSSSSGTISTGYTSTGSHLSSIVSVEAAMATPFSSCAKQTEEIKKDRIKRLIGRFFGGRSGINNGGISDSVLEEWFGLLELDVGWVLHVADDGASAGDGIRKHSNAPSWIRALDEITETIDLMASLFPQMEERIPDQLQFIQFVEKTMFKMLAFVDAIVAPNANRRMPQPYEELGTLLGVRDALSRASGMIRFPIHSQTSPEAERIQHQVVNLLSEKEGKAGDAAWSKMEQIRTESLEEAEHSFLPRQGSSDIHRVAESVMRYISFLRYHYSSVASVVSEAASLGKCRCVPQIEDPSPSNSMIVEIASCLEEKLAKMSGSFPDQGLGLLFLLNNTYFIRETLLFPFLVSKWSFIRVTPHKYSSLDVQVAALFEKVEGYIESYLQVSWAPVLSCLFNPTHLQVSKKKNPTHLRFWRRYSPLCKFESQFQKTYTKQMLWKVPDPKLRKTLRTAITEKIVPGYTKYIEDNNVTTPKFTPQKLEEMLQELFEG